MATERIRDCAQSNLLGSCWVYASDDEIQMTWPSRATVWVSNGSFSRAQSTCRAEGTPLERLLLGSARHGYVEDT